MKHLFKQSEELSKVDCSDQVVVESQVVVEMESTALTVICCLDGRRRRRNAHIYILYGYFDTMIKEMSRY
jgi:hypothetical protein